MKILKVIPGILAIVLLCSAIMLSDTGSKKTKPKKNIALQTTSIIESTEELRGVWVSYIDLDMRGTDMTYKSFKKKFKNIADTSKKDGFNTLIVQVRPFSDALYKSAYFPYSHLLTGVQGKYPGYDPLDYMCNYCHKIGLKIHAWVNPYRVRLESNPKKFSENNPYMNNKALGKKAGNGIYYNPALKAVRKLIELGIKEIVENYKIDGVQFDDYFYPTSDKSFDKQEYEKYVNSCGAGKALSLSNWRIANVNVLIAETYHIIHSIKKDVIFGISPQGNINNNYDLYADVKSWCSKEGYIDYICPQLYYSLKNPALTFEDALKSWKKLDYCNKVSLYIGIAGYKTGTDSDEGTWKKSNIILSKELKIIRSNGIKGFMLYSFNDLQDKRAEKEINNLKKLLD